MHGAARKTKQAGAPFRGVALSARAGCRQTLSLSRRSCFSAASASDDRQPKMASMSSSDRPLSSGTQNHANTPESVQKAANRKNMPKPSELAMYGVERAMMNWNSHWQQAV